MNIETFNKFFDEEWIENLRNVYDHSTVRGNENYFRNMGLYYDRYKNTTVTEDIVLYFRELFFPPNICILHHVLENIEYFRDKKFLDYGCGIGVFSIFMDKLGIECFNFDNFSQLKSSNFIDNYNEAYDRQIGKIYDEYPIEVPDVVTNSGILISEVRVFQSEILMLDSNHVGNVKSNLNEFELIKSYKGLTNIYRKIL